MKTNSRNPTTTTITITLLAFFTITAMSSSDPVSGAPLAVVENASNCVQLIDRADKALQNILWIGDRNLPVPESLTAMEGQCKKLKSSVKGFRAYGKCIRLFPKQVFNIFVNNAKKAAKTRCDTEAGRSDFVRVTSCYANDTKTNLDRVIDQMVVFTQHVSDTIPNENKLPWVCCGYLYTGVAIRGELNKTCGVETQTYTENLMRNMFSDVMDLSCGKFSVLGNCHTLLPKSNLKYKELTAVKVLSPVSSIWKPLSKITQTLEESR